MPLASAAADVGGDPARPPVVEPDHAERPGAAEVIDARPAIDTDDDRGVRGGPGPKAGLFLDSNASDGAFCRQNVSRVQVSRRPVSEGDVRRKSMSAAQLRAVPRPETCRATGRTPGRTPSRSRRSMASRDPMCLVPDTVWKLYRESVVEARDGLRDAERRSDAMAALRSMLERIVLTPEGDKLGIVLRGDLASMLAAAGPKSEASETHLRIKLVAGARNRLDLARWWTAA
jgi:hypothetical protein